MSKRKKGITFILILTLLITTGLTQSFANGNLSHEEIETVIEEVAKEKNIPSVILKAIAWKESKYNQFDSNGTPFISNGNTGIMQINRIHRHLDQEKLKYDLKYNIEAGANILLGRWNASGSIYPIVGDMDPNVLEHWYFALWGYNGWVARNNPNASGKKAFQEEIFELIRDKYNQPITSIDTKYLPSSGLPKDDLWVPTPKDHHFGDLNGDDEVIFKDLIDHPKQEYIEELYSMGIVSGVSSDKFQPDGHVTKEQMAKIVVDALGIEITKGKSVGKDWSDVSSWAKDYVATAHQYGILSTDEEGNIKPKEFITREDTIMMLFDGFREEIINEEELMVPIDYEDFNEISLLALDSVAYFIGKDVLTVEEDNYLLRPQDPITRGEMCKLMYKIIENLY
ncbi:S-layer homology domain-containing protein [Anaerovirgula multivorans]|uniref:S-layer homology domain-containing protein n=1 Tax=Anaerovirgula multivorans TaxID=312168 RepID=A0A239EW36_9FIRM|nr:S-layer homology domain-containing protein [Anaerovirgula multivorans]SNS48797.1 S-layer homology domain-containing protein [Anaerovirgula multivorans]